MALIAAFVINILTYRSAFAKAYNNNYYYYYYLDLANNNNNTGLGSPAPFPWEPPSISISVSHFYVVHTTAAYTLRGWKIIIPFYFYLFLFLASPTFELSRLCAYTCLLPFSFSVCVFCVAVDINSQLHGMGERQPPFPLGAFCVHRHAWLVVGGWSPSMPDLYLPHVG